MLLARRLDRECIALQRQGELTVYPGFEGQEAAQIGSATALGPEDFVFPTFRELAAALVRGVDPVQYLAYHRGTWHGGPYDPMRDAVRTDLHPGRDPDRARGRIRDGARPRRHAARARCRTSATAARAKATSTRRRTSRACSRPRRSCSARTTAGRSACPTARQTRGRGLGAGGGVRLPGRARRRQRRARGLPSDTGRRRARLPWRGSDPDRGADLPHRRPLDGRRPRQVPRRRRGRGGQVVRSDREVPGMAPRARPCRRGAARHVARRDRATRARDQGRRDRAAGASGRVRCSTGPMPMLRPRLAEQRREALGG